MKKYIIVFIVVFIGYLVGNSIYTEMSKDKTPGKAKRLACQKATTTFERGFGIDEIKVAQNLLIEGNVKFTSSIEKSRYAQSRLFDFISLSDTDKIFQNALDQYIKADGMQSENPLKISYNIYENDINDPGKKTKKSKLYAGYIVLEVKNENNKIIYKVQRDFMDKKGADIAQSIQCCVDSFATYK